MPFAAARGAARPAPLPAPPQATFRVAVENSTPVPTDRTPVPLQTTVLSSAQDQGPATTASTVKAETPKSETPAAEPDTTKQDTTKQETPKPEAGKPDTAAAPATDGKPDSKDAKPDTKPDTAAQPTAPPATPVQTAVSDCPGNPNALGTSRVLAIDPADFKHIGHMQYPDSLPLQDKEVVITFDDGPLPPYSNQILDILASQCVKVTYFLVGEMARAYPSIVRREYEAGHTHRHPQRAPPAAFRRTAARTHALGNRCRHFRCRRRARRYQIHGAVLPHSGPRPLQSAGRGARRTPPDRILIGHGRGRLAPRIGPEQIRSLALKRLQALGKGILLLHDIHAKTVAALPGILKDLKDNGFRIVQVVPSASYEIAMANKPRAHAPMLASAMPNLPSSSRSAPASTIPQLSRPGRSRRWRMPRLMSPRCRRRTPAISSRTPASVKTAGNVQWPDQPKSATSRRAAGDEDNSERTSHHARHRKHDSDSAEHQGRHHHRERARGGSDGHRADLVTKIKALAGLFTPAH